MGAIGQATNHSDDSAPDDADHSNRVGDNIADPRNIIVSIDVRNSKAARLHENGDMDCLPVAADACQSGDTTQTAHSSDGQCDSPMTLTHADSCVFSSLMKNNDCNSEWQDNIYMEQGLETAPPFDFDSVDMMHANRADCACVSCSLVKSDSLCSHCGDSNNFLKSFTGNDSDRNLLDNDGGVVVKTEVPHSVASLAGSNASNSGRFEHRESMDIVDGDKSSKSGGSRSSGESAERIFSGADEDEDLEVVFTAPRTWRGDEVSLCDSTYLDEHMNWEGVDGVDRKAEVCTNLEVKIESEPRRSSERDQLFQFGTVDCPPLSEGKQAGDGDEDESYHFHAVAEQESSGHRFDESSEEGVDLSHSGTKLDGSVLSDIFS